MGVRFDTVGDSISRSGAFFSPSQDFTLFFYAKWVNATTGFRCVRWLAAADNDYANPYIYAGTKTSGTEDFTVEFYNGSAFATSATTTLVPGTWYWFGIVYEAAITQFRFYRGPVSGAATLIDSKTINMGAVNPFVLDQMGEDGGGGQSNIDVAYERVWQEALTSAQLETEADYVSAVLATDLECDCPLPNTSNMTDSTINNRDWTATGTLAFVDSPVGILFQTLPDQPRWFLYSFELKPRAEERT